MKKTIYHINIDLKNRVKMEERAIINGATGGQNQLFNHNIRYKNLIYHIQTEKMYKSGKDIIYSQIFNKGEVIYSKSIDLSTFQYKNIKTLLATTHRETILYLRRSKMNINGLKKAIKNLVDNGGKGILGMDIFSKSTNMSVVGYNSNPKACALFGQIYKQLLKSLDGSGFPVKLSYYYLMLETEQAVLVGKVGEDYLYGILLDLKELPLGMLLSILLPEFTKDVTESIKS